MAMTPAGNGMYVGAKNDVIVILGTNRGTYRACFCEALPLPGTRAIKDSDPCRRYKTIYFLKPDDTDRYEEALEDLEALSEKIRVPSENIWRDEGDVVPWNGTEPFTFII